MEYHQHNPHFGPQNGGLGSLPSDSLPSSSEKALMWSTTNYMSESGYSTQAPSISSIDAFLNNDQLDTTISNNKIEPQQPQHFIQPPTQQQQYQQPASTETEEDNAVVNWINYQDSSELALKAIPELLKLLVDEDLVVVQQAASLLKTMSNSDVPRQALIQTPNAVKCLVNCLMTTADLDTARNIVGALYGVSWDKKVGVQSIIESAALDPLVKMLSAPADAHNIVSYSITTLHNVLLVCNDQIKQNLRKMGIIHHMIPLLGLNQNVKLLSIVVDCLQILAFGNKEAKQIIHDYGGTEAVVNLLATNFPYQKLLLNLTRLLKVLSACTINKPKLVQLNTMQLLSQYLVNRVNNDITNNCLIALRNMSDAATRLNGLEQLIQNVTQLLATSNDYQMNFVAAGILSNLTCNNENNKRACVKANGVKIILKLIETNMINLKPQLIDALTCTLRHITCRHQDHLLAQEQFRLSNGINLMVQLLSMKPRLWMIIKPALGLIRNICANQVNSNELKSNCIIEKLMQVLYDAYSEIYMRLGAANLPNSQQLKIDDVNLFDIVDASSSALLILAKEYQNQILMKDLDCIGFFLQMFYSPNILIQKAAISLLAELAQSKECCEVIEQQPTLNQFVQANFCNQYGQLKTISEIAGNCNSNVSIVLQHVTALMQRLQEFRNHRAQFFQQQQQQQRQMYHQQPPQSMYPPQQQPMEQQQAGYGGMPPPQQTHQLHQIQQQQYGGYPQQSFPPQQYY